MGAILALGLCLSFLSGAILYTKVTNWIDNKLWEARLEAHNKACEKARVPHLKVYHNEELRKHAVTAA